MTEFKYRNKRNEVRIGIVAENKQKADSILNGIIKEVPITEGKLGVWIAE